MLPKIKIAKVIAIVSAALICQLPLNAASNAAAADPGVPARLSAIETLLKQVADALKPPAPAAQKTRLLLPFVTAQAGFDTGISIANTGKDSTGVIGKAGVCTINYFGTVVGGGATPASQTTNAVVAPGGSLVFTLSSGGNFGIAATPGFQGYIEIICDFPFAHGYGLLTDGPIGQARVGTSIPVLVLPLVRTSAFEESLGR